MLFRTHASHAPGILSIAVIGLCLAADTNAACQYEITAIITGPSCGITGPSGVIAYGLSETGEIVGYRPDCLTTATRAFRWTAQSGFQTIHNQIGFPGLASSELRGVNAAGAVAGNASLNGPSYPHAFVIPSPGAPAIEIPIPSGALATEARAINEAGQVAGRWELLQGVRGFTWHNGVFTDLTEVMPPWPHVWPFDINNGGAVVGYFKEADLAPQRAFLWSKGKTTDLGPIPGGTTSVATGINDYGVVVGTGTVVVSGSTLSRAFVWHAGEFLVIEPLSGANQIGVLDVNNRGVVVGLSECNPNGCQTRAVIYVNGELLDLNDLLVEPFDDNLILARSVNDAGQVLCGARSGPTTAAVLLTPVGRSVTDLDGDCRTGTTDLQILLSRWNTTDALADFNGDATVGFHDLVMILIAWG